MTARSKFWLITLSALLAVAATLALGLWQLSRAAQKQAVQASIDVKAASPALNGPALASLSAPALEMYRGVSLRGRWLAEQTVFLDNRPMNGKPGLYVVTPMKLEDGGAPILVLRGWVARNFVDRASVPTLETSAGVVEIQGRIVPPPSKLYELGGTETGRIRQNLDIAQFRAETGLPLLSVWVQQTGAASEGLLREWPLARMGVDKNYGYAFQWFGLSGLIAILYVWFQIVRRFIYPKRA
ncbi:SURF1 family protein [Rhodoferax sp.]|uniref:SURF1 family protein n=1 Tax=Rhodoferax sp. TaxID=50421 RepID=UPI0027197740|nr:SURF1 family protein [Rhodoferax sp.]MDO9195169.1 SURF1 family protein [Rhodoferax sp.]